MYVDGSIKTYEQGHAATFDAAGALPLYPGDNCEGLTNCRCSWSIEETETEVHATWTIGGDDPCAPCEGNASAYNPFIVSKLALGTARR